MNQCHQSCLNCLALFKEYNVSKFPLDNFSLSVKLSQNGNYRQTCLTGKSLLDVITILWYLGQKKIISFSGTAPLHFHMPHLSFYSAN